ncbi:MAG: alanine--tRNA ligase [Candidatus Eremiobacteraeota bacterium]|nr:alanine--tRNA ligase [Candidatus Eremiobacteraeota bacterium]
MWDSRKIRESFLMFFEAKGHLRLPSFPLIPNNDPTLLLIGAGMAPLKPMFKGEISPPAPRITTCQKCIRVGDIERVGKTSRHHTFFEMLGNFSFGDYYKKETCEWAWEYITEIMKLDSERLWISIHPEDNEAMEIWKKIGIPDEKILLDDTNFWGPVGDSGPCGPCSELLYDRGERYSCGPDCKPGCDCDRYIEIWNLVFTGLFKNTNGNFSDLPKHCIDTGLGFERLVMVIQDKPSPYETELFMPIIKELRNISRKTAPGKITNIKERIIADHIRSLVFMASDGVFPSNEGRGYVFRRLLRKAVKTGIDLGIKDEFLYNLVPVVIENYGDIYPELIEHSEYTREVTRQEETGFLDTIDTGMEILQEIIEGCKKEGKPISGKSAFLLYDTYGFPLELTEEMALEAELLVNKEEFRQEFEREMKFQREKSRKAIENFSSRYDISMETIFVGHNNDEKLESGEEVEAIFITLDKKETGDKAPDKLDEGETGFVLLNPTPFYAESGGQVGDTGEIKDESGENIAEVIDTILMGNLHISKVKVLKGTIKKGHKYMAYVDMARRREIRRHHTATHLLHWALRKVLGPHVTQSGSYVGPDRLRFDFTHFREVIPEELKEIEELVNQQILENHMLRVDIVPMKKAMEEGAMALFGEKYGETVRMVSVGDFSKELCGGSHLEQTGEAGIFIITSESAIGRGLRRIEAVCGSAALKYIDTIRKTLTESSRLLKSKPENLPDTINRLKESLREKENIINEMEKKLSVKSAGDFLKEARDISGIKIFSRVVSGYSPRALRELGDHLCEGLKSGAIFLGQKSGDKGILLFMMTPDLVKRGFSARKLIKIAAEVISGKGGGRPDFAQAGGKDPSKLPGALKKAEEILLQELSKSKTEV